MVAEPQCAAGVNFLVKRIAPLRFNCSTPRRRYAAMARPKFIMTRLSVPGPAWSMVSYAVGSRDQARREKRYEFSVWCVASLLVTARYQSRRDTPPAIIAIYRVSLAVDDLDLERIILSVHTYLFDPLSDRTKCRGSFITGGCLL